LIRRTEGGGEIEEKSGGDEAKKGGGEREAECRANFSILFRTFLSLLYVQGRRLKGSTKKDERNLTKKADAVIANNKLPYPR